MFPKCSLSGYNPVLQLLGLLFMAIILVSVVIYYLQVYHSSILEKYADAASGAVNPASIRYHAFTANAAAAADQTIYAGANISADKSNSFTLRDCKVYFTDDIDGCDKIQDTPTKTCSYKFDGWSEFDTYTDKDGSAITYGKKIYKRDATGTLLNAHLNSKCFKEFDGGGARGFEYINNPLVVYSAKGITDNGVEDANTFGGKKYTSIQFINATDAGDNFAKVIESICSVKYDAISALTGKVFYKFVFDTDKKITEIQKVRFNDNQTGIEKVQENALTDFASKGSHGLRFNNSGGLQVFVNDTDIKTNMNIFKLNYLTNICTNAQIKDYTSYISKNVNISNFVSFNIKSGGSKEVVINIEDLNLIEADAKSEFSTKNGNTYINYKNEILEYITRKEQGIVTTLTTASTKNKTDYEKIIKDKEKEKIDGTSRKDNFNNKSFADIINLKVNNQNIFNYSKGYKNNVLDAMSIPIPSGVEAYVVNNIDICLIFKNNERLDQKSYTFIVPLGKSYVCDVLVVGGGGGGGGALGGGGGAGAVVNITGATFNNGTYNISVGRGGNSYNNGSENGRETTISGGVETIKAEGGGGTTWGHDSGNGNAGGSGGGAAAPNQTLTYGGAAGRGSSLGRFSGNIYANRGGNIISRRTWNRTNSAGGGGAGSAARNIPPSEDWAGEGGAGILINITGNDVFYGGGGGGSGHIANGGIGGIGGGGKGDREGGAGGGEGEPNTGGGGGGGGWGGNKGGRGGSGIVIIRIKNIISTPSLIDDYYKAEPVLPPVMPITISSLRIQSNILTSFVYLQAGFYRFKADIGTNDAVNLNLNIIYAELVIYDESNLSGSTYNCKKVFKYKKYGTGNKPSYSRQYIQIPKNKFYKLAYTYYYFNNTASNIDDNFNIYCKYLDIAPPVLEGSLPEGVIAWYRFDGNIDNSKSGYNLTAYGSSPFYPNDLYLNRRYINTKEGAVYISSIDLARKSFSIALWMRTKTSSAGYFINQGQVRNNNNSDYLHIGHRGNNQYLLGFWGNDLECGEGTGTKGNYPEDIGRWVHLAFIVELEPNNTCKRKIYRNGELISQNSGRAQYVGSGELYIGRTPFWGNHYNDIDISDFIIFNKAMTQEEVKSLWRSAPSQQSTTTTSVPLTIPSNDDALFARDNIAEINTSLNKYLFTGTDIHAAYNNTDLISLFSTIKYENNNSTELKAYLNNKPIDYFNLNSLETKITEEQRKYDGENTLLTTRIRDDPTIAKYKKLYNNIYNINLQAVIPFENLTLKTGASFISIFGNNKENDYITYDKVSNINNLANPALTPTVFVEAI
jgi:hypothetical protein